ncbi:hypothetical protein NMY22_g4027 [Coprinellus aureogranulatus]|nr:hypothetical protein NMY22_g4027 [Coprinellus aureogranulatus]
MSKDNEEPGYSPSTIRFVSDVYKDEWADGARGSWGWGEPERSTLGAKWKELDDEEKKPYIELANKDKTRAENEKASYDKGAKKAAAAAAASGSGEEDEDED